ncbi:MULTISPECIES: type VII secretion protein EccB [Mycobacterium]|uniref:Type VII secretion protein EccB n=1 Tax=Mycobacterium kiyosense TaxID=2871094 RepID=A0A9P3QBN5_9MYCO|nr:MULTISPECIES: type VII secretion protein EccB [Mycobacterium]BDE12459.1 type VII secretion protein EccB [Mycobacterium sp. 20KCMC460]GLB85017.1 type VII secretion protein EccB [Mycobacterium kiyosense]GLB89807.1 type VII secretion protein EccB [Mycobacterium kiyosense]GLB97792.1 type VII secretion protein EccB [Mycobacterium kiyosense]GLC03311.1 type VII secretion protein EccB [Mycobacterium kiyosense]
MPRQASTWLHTSGHRFLLRRIESALLGEDPGSISEPPRAPAAALALGCVLAVAALLGCACLALLRPQPGLGDVRLVMGRQSGALYVRLADTWHPVLNLASARLILAAAADPVPVRESELEHTKRGALLGIPGAPQFIPAPLPERGSTWTICDSDPGPETTVIIGTATDASVRRLDPGHAAVVSTGPGSPTFLLYRGLRAAVDLADPAVRQVLGLAEPAPQRASQSLLNAIPEAPPIAAPRIPGAGAPAGPWLPDLKIGSVLRITRASGDEYYVVLADGVQRIGRVAADLLRIIDSHRSTQPVAVAPDVIRGVPVVHTLPVAGIAEQAPSGYSTDATVCAAWTPGPSGAADVGLLTGAGPPVGQAFKLAQADGRGPAVDAVHLPPGRSVYVAAQSLTGTGARVATRYLVTDTGVRFAIHDDDAARALGLPATTAAAPWPILAALPCGPELSREKALVAHDAIVAGAR